MISHPYPLSGKISQPRSHSQDKGERERSGMRQSYRPGDGIYQYHTYPVPLRHILPLSIQRAIFLPPIPYIGHRSSEWYLSTKQWMMRMMGVGGIDWRRLVRRRTSLELSLYNHHLTFTHHLPLEHRLLHLLLHQPYLQPKKMMRSSDLMIYNQRHSPRQQRQQPSWHPHQTIMAENCYYWCPLLWIVKSFQGTKKLRKVKRIEGGWDWVRKGDRERKPDDSWWVVSLPNSLPSY